jgi:hypothetical protein
MNIADAINPFFFQHDTDSVRDAVTNLIVKAGHTTIYSAVDEVTIANNTAIAKYATIVKDENDLTIYGLDVVLACDLLHKDRGALASRSIEIYCRKLTILGTEDDGLTIDVSAYVDDQCNTHIQPDISASLANTSQKAACGNDIAIALANPSPENPWNKWFNNNPGKGWGEPGAPGGCILIACETLVVSHKLYLKANGAQGNAGVGGQNVKNWILGLVGGDAGHGGRGGDSGNIVLTCNAVQDRDGKPVNLFDQVEVECNAGRAGDPGLPGFAYDADQQNRHFGSYAGPVDAGTSNDAVRVEPRALAYTGDSGPQTIADVSMVATGSSLHFWALLYHRAKLEYLKNQPLKYRMPVATDPSWIALGDLVKWTNRLCFAYGDTSDELKGACFADVGSDPDLATKNSIARAFKLMTTWYLAGKTMWGTGVTTVPALPFNTLCSYVDSNFVYQKGVRDFYIKLRTQLANAIKSNDDLTVMSNAAEYAVRMHKAAVDDLKKLMYGSTDKSGVDAMSLLGELNVADSDCNSLILKLGEDLAGLDDKINSALGIGVSDVLESLKSMCFVMGDPKAFIAMGAVEGFGLYEKAKNNVTDDAGNSLAKDAVIKQIHQMKGSVNDLGKMVNGMVSNKQVGKLDHAILTSLDNIDAYVSKFTTALGEAGTKVLDEVSSLRQKVNYKNDIWMEYNDRLYQLAKEWEDYQTALAKKQQIDMSSQQELSANLVDAVQLYTGIYLNNLERTADLWAKLVRKFAYVTLNADLPSADFLENITAFWTADRAAAQGIADQADGNWDINESAVVGSKDSSSVRYQLSMYNAGSQAIVIKAPDDTAKNKKSTFYITIRGDGSENDRKVIKQLLNHSPVWLQILPPATFHGNYTDARGETCKPPAISQAVFAYPLVAGSDWDVRVTHVNPWVEGVQTNTGTVQFHIKLGTKAYIVDANSPPVARYFDYNQKAVNTQFAHLTDIHISDPTNDGMAGDAAGEVSDENIDKRGIFVQLQLAIPDGGLNAGLKPATDISRVSMQVHFRVIFRASVNALAMSRRKALP